MSIERFGDSFMGRWRENKEEKICLGCGKSFTGKTNQVFCNGICRGKYLNTQKKLARREQNEDSENTPTQ